MASLGLVFDILARDNASPTFKKVGDAAESAGKRGAGAVSSLAGSLKGVGAALAGSAIIAGLGKTIGAASDLNETVNKSNVIFGRNAGEIQKWASGASKNLGLSKGAAIEAAAGFGNMFTQLGFTGDAATGMSEQVVQLSADLGSFNNLPTADVADMISSAFRGEYDSLQRLIPNINAARVEQEAMAETGKKNAKELTAQEKAAAVLAIVQKDGAAAAGDFAKTSDGLANSSKIAAAQFEDLQAEIGQKFLPAAQAAMGFVSDTAIPAVRAFADGAFSLAGAFGALPGPVKLAAGAFVAWSVLGGKVTDTLGRLKTSGAVKVFDDLRLKMMYAKEEGEGLRSKIGAVGSAAGTAAAGAIGSLARAVGPELVAAVAVGGMALLVDNFKKITNAGAGAKEQIDDVNDSLAETGNAGRVDATAASVNRLRDSMADAQAIVDVHGGDQGFLANLLGPSAIISGQAAAVGDAQASVDLFGDAIEDLDRKQKVANDTATTLADTFHLTQDEVLSLADKYKIDLSDGITESTRLFGNFYSQEYGTKPTEAAADLTAATEDTEKAIDAAKDAVDAYKLSLDILSGKTVSTIEVEAALEGALDSAKDAVKDLDGSVKTANGSLNLHSEAGRAASDVLLDIRSSGNQLISTMIEQGATTDEVTAKDKKLRESFIRSAQQMGFSKGEARKLADQILGIPDERETQIKADTRAANEAINGVQTNIDDLHGKTVTVEVRAAGRFIVNPNGGLQEFWKGGYTGPGGMYDVKGLVHGDEFVVPKWRVNALGGPAAVARAVGMDSDIGGPAAITVLHDTRALESSMTQVAGAMKDAIPKAGVAGSGSVGGSWTSIYNWVKARIPQARWNSTYRPGDPGYHGLGKAVDFGYGSGPGGAGSAGLALINRTLHDGLGANLAELIYDGLYDDRPDLKNGRPLDYGPATRAEHRNHVHAAVYDSGGILPPGLTMAYNGTGRNEHVVKSDGGGLVGLRIEGRLDASGYLDGVVVAALDDQYARGQY